MITINEVELATKLAHNGMYDEVTNPLYDGDMVLCEDDLYNYDEEQESGTYKEEFQKIFDRHYDYFYNEIINRSA